MPDFVHVTKWAHAIPQVQTGEGEHVIRLDWLRTQLDFGRRYVNDVHRHFGAGRNTPVLDPRRSHDNPT
jgi:hypothetical protein